MLTQGVRGIYTSSPRRVNESWRSRLPPGYYPWLIPLTSFCCLSGWPSWEWAISNFRELHHWWSGRAMQASYHNPPYFLPSEQHLSQLVSVFLQTLYSEPVPLIMRVCNFSPVTPSSVWVSRLGVHCFHEWTLAVVGSSVKAIIWFKTPSHWFIVWTPGSHLIVLS